MDKFFFLPEERRLNVKEVKGGEKKKIVLNSTHFVM